LTRDAAGDSPFFLFIGPWRQCTSAAAQARLRNYDRHPPDGCTATAILPGDGKIMTAARQLRREIAEMAVRPDVGDGFSIDD